MTYTGGPYVDIEEIEEYFKEGYIEAITNGSFEEGTNGWTWNGMSRMNDFKCCGEWAARGVQINDYVEQNHETELGYAIPVDSIVSYDCQMFKAEGGTIRVTFYYKDTSSNSHDFIVTGSCVEYNLLTWLTAGKNLIKTRFTIVVEGRATGIDCVSLIFLGDIEGFIGLNIPYSRVSDALQLIAENTITDEFVPFEWWFDYTGKLYFKEKRGTDKSASVKLEAGDQIGGSKKEQISKQSTQRVRVTGRGESADQDLNTSDWYENISEEDNVNSFYESIESEKSLSSKEETDIWAQVLLAQNSPIRNEITITLENDFYTADDYDLGDEVTVTDPATGLSGKYRVKTIEKWINGDGGETVQVTVSKRRTDIMDRLSNLFKILERMKNSSTYLDVLYGEGSKQTKIKADEVEDIWEQTSSNEWAIELPEEDTADTNLVECDVSGVGITIACDKDEFSLTCNPNSMGYTFLTEPLLKYSRDPRFTLEFEIDTDVGDAWATNDYCYIRIWQVDDTGGWCAAPWGDGGFGFRIMKTASNYELEAYLHNGYTTRHVKVANILTDVKYIIESRMEWKEKVVKYYFGKADVDKDDPQWGFRLRAILPILVEGQALDIDGLAPFHITIDSRNAPQTQTLIIVFFRWRTQAIRAVKP